MDDIYLTSREKLFLFALRFFKKLRPHFDVSKLLSYGLLSENGKWIINESGKQVFDRVYSLTDDAIRYRIAKRQDFWKRVITPITVTIITDAILNGIRWLLELLSKLPTKP